MTKVKKSAKCSEKSTSSSESVSSLSSDEEIDASNLKPIKDYLSNRRELAHQLFKSVKTEKIRMMLPQVLKKVDLGELEECCASELSGMSKSRILSILNGQPMVESSNTSDSDDSGPSLEIISDTEEWLTDDDIVKTEDGVSSTSRKTKVKKDKTTNKGKGHLSKKSEKNKTKVKTKSNQKEIAKQKDVKVKKEGEKEANKDKEGDSLLDLLELEMRARAIRALIRKEEDIIPEANANKDSSSSSTPRVNNRNKISQDELRAKENCRKQLEKIITSKQVSIGDDEDVVLVVQPTPTIELLSSESENDERLPSKSTKTQQSSKSNSKSSTTNRASCSEDISEQSKAKLSETTQISTTKPENVENTKSSTIQPECSLEKRRKMSYVNIKNKIKSRNGIALNENRNAECSNEKAALSPSSNILTIESTSNRDQISKSEQSNKQENMAESFNKNNPEDIATVNEKAKNETRSMRRRVTSEDERLADMEEIIDLDDYPDDMDDMDNYDHRKSGMNPETECKTVQVKTDDNTLDKSNTAETWATRYYQTDDVQNVIKESKMQSEIRKRLRERQRLSKLNNSPTTNSTSTTAAADSSSADKPKTKPTGSVEEYLALKRINPAVGSSDNNSTSINASAENVMITETAAEGNKQNQENKTESIIGNTVVDNESTRLNSNLETQISSHEKDETAGIKDVKMQPG